jgi:hypothetical protein
LGDGFTPRVCKQNSIKTAFNFYDLYKQFSGKQVPQAFSSASKPKLEKAETFGLNRFPKLVKNPSVKTLLV